MAAMAFETGETFSPSIKNKASGATGLIQFMRSTAKGSGTTTAALAEMTAVDQLDFVEKISEAVQEQDVDGLRCLHDDPVSQGGGKAGSIRSVQEADQGLHAERGAGCQQGRSSDQG
jgi:hypothetical protein